MVENPDNKFQILTNTAYKSSPVRWKLRKALQKERDNLLNELSILEKINAPKEIISKNKEYLQILEELTETFRPSQIHEQPLEKLRKENRAIIKKLKPKEAIEEETEEITKKKEDEEKKEEKKDENLHTQI